MCEKWCLFCQPEIRYLLEREEILIIREIFPDPNCSQGSPVGLHCVVLLPRLTYSQAEADCGARKMRLWPGPDQDLSQVRTKSQIFSRLENVSRSKYFLLRLTTRFTPSWTPRFGWQQKLKVCTTEHQKHKQ